MIHERSEGPRPRMISRFEHKSLLACVRECVLVLCVKLATYSDLQRRYMLWRSADVSTFGPWSCAAYVLNRVSHSYVASQCPTILALSCFTWIILHPSSVVPVLHLHVFELFYACTCTHWRPACACTYPKLGMFLHVSTRIKSWACSCII